MCSKLLEYGFRAFATPNGQIQGSRFSNRCPRNQCKRASRKAFPQSCQQVLIQKPSSQSPMTWYPWVESFFFWTGTSLPCHWNEILRQNHFLQLNIKFRIHWYQIGATQWCKIAAFQMFYPSFTMIRLCLRTDMGSWEQNEVVWGVWLLVFFVWFVANSTQVFCES